MGWTQQGNGQWVLYPSNTSYANGYTFNITYTTTLDTGSLTKGFQKMNKTATGLLSVFDDFEPPLQVAPLPVEQISEDDLPLDALPAFVHGNELYSLPNIDDFNESSSAVGVHIKVDDATKANLVSSKIGGKRKHKVILDLDYEASLIPSSTEGHFHLYLDKELNEEQMEKLVDVLEEVGIIATGNANQWRRSRAMFLRLPWIKKKVKEDA